MDAQGLWAHGSHTPAMTEKWDRMVQKRRPESQVPGDKEGCTVVRAELSEAEGLHVAWRPQKGLHPEWPKRHIRGLWS